MGLTLSRLAGVVVSGVAIVLLVVGPGWAGAPVPAPLVGVTGPVGLVVSGAAYGGYLLFKRLRHRD